MQFDLDTFDITKFTAAVVAVTALIRELTRRIRFRIEIERKISDPPPHHEVDDMTYPTDHREPTGAHKLLRSRIRSRHIKK